MSDSTENEFYRTSHGYLREFPDPYSDRGRLVMHQERIEGLESKLKDADNSLGLLEQQFERFRVQAALEISDIETRLVEMENRVSAQDKSPELCRHELRIRGLEDRSAIIDCLRMEVYELKRLVHDSSDVDKVDQVDRKAYSDNEILEDILFIYNELIEANTTIATVRRASKISRKIIKGSGLQTNLNLAFLRLQHLKEQISE